MSIDISDLVLAMHPVGSFYFSADPTDPSIIFGGGGWERVRGRFLWCETDEREAGTTGGEESHTLSVGEMPSHTHTRGTMNITGHIRFVNPYNYNNENINNAVYGAFYVDTFPADEGAGINQNSTPSGDGVWSVTYDASRSWTGATSSVGSSNPHNNMPPYLSVYCWKRIS